MKKLSKKEIECIETRENVHIDGNMYNLDKSSEMGWQPIPEKWKEKKNEEIWKNEKIKLEEIMSKAFLSFYFKYLIRGE